MAADILQQLPQLEALCERLYNSQDPQERSQAEQFLRVFGLSTEYISHCKAILDNSKSPYAQLFASSSLLKVVTEHTLSVPVKLEMRNYFLTYLDSQGPGLESFVVTSLVQLLTRMTKLSWYDDDQVQKIVQDAQRFLAKGSTGGGSQGHYLLGLKILNMLVSEMNQPTAGRTLTQHRKVAVSFRDTALFQVFQLSVVALGQLKNQAADDKLTEQALSLALGCLSFDFVGTCMDESSEDLGTIQVPSIWRQAIEDTATLQLFFDYYAATVPPLSNMALECLVRLASVRRSLFSNEAARSAFLNRLVAGTREILAQQQGLARHANYHEFCRLLGRLKTNYQLSELVNVDNYGEWIQMVAELTVRSLNSWQWAASSVYYLLGLWSRLVSSMQYLKGETPSLLETYAPKITEAYVTSRLEAVRVVLAGGGGVEDPLDNEEQLGEQMDALPYLCRFQYERTSDYLCGIIDPLIAAYSKATAGGPGQDSTQVAVLEGQLAWMVHIIAAVVKGRMSQAENQETLDGELAARVFGLLQLVDGGVNAGRYGERSRQRLELALLTFFQSFRKVYVGEQVMHSSKVYVRLTERLGLNDHLMVLSVMLTKIATNLKVFGACEEVISLTLTLLQDLAAGYMSSKLLMKLEGAHFLLQHHGAEHFPFLTDPANARNRTVFTFTLARLLFMEDTPAKFKTFVAPMQQVLVAVAAASSGSASAAGLRASIPREQVIGLFRDLRGLTQATTSRKTYGLLFDWLYPAHMPTLLMCLEAWADSPEVTNSLLKFMAEFVLNKSQRLTFDSSSPNGILLFREVSKVLVTYGSRVLQLGSVPDVYTHKYKGIWVCLTILTRALSGNYVNFGVFELYGDPAFKDAMDMALKLALSMPLSDIVGYRKAGKAYYGLLEVLCHHHAAVVCGCDQPTFAFILASLDAGLRSLDLSISSQCAAAVDNLAGFYFKHMQAGGAGSAAKAAQAMAEHMQRQPQLFPQILNTLFEIVLFEDCANQWSLSRPMLSLILILEAVYGQLRAQLIASQPGEARQHHLAHCLDRLMADVQRNLEPKNRDKFTQNLTLARHDYRAGVKA